MLYPPDIAAASLISLGCPADAGKVEELIKGQSILDCIIFFLNSIPLFKILSRGSEAIATLPPFGPIEGQKWFDQIFSQ
jgi:hypothetical protein